MEHGPCNTRWLPKACVTGAGVLLGATGNELRQHDVRLIATKTSAIGDIIEWSWIAR